MQGFVGDASVDVADVKDGFGQLTAAVSDRRHVLGLLCNQRDLGGGWSGVLLAVWCGGQLLLLLLLVLEGGLRLRRSVLLEICWGLLLYLICGHAVSGYLDEKRWELGTSEGFCKEGVVSRDNSEKTNRSINR